MARRAALAIACAVAAQAALCGPALALSVSVSTTPAQMTLRHDTPGTSTSVITISNVLAIGSWTLSIRDAGATTPGKMDRVNCSTRAPLTGSLANALAWSSSWGAGLGGSGSGSGTLTGSDQTLASGSTLVLTVGTINVAYTQSLGALESVASGDCYQVTVTLTAV